MRFYSKWYCAVSGVDVVAWRFRLDLHRYIFCANVKVCQCQVMISNGLLEETMSNVFFLKYFTINYILNFLYIIFSENPVDKLNNMIKSMSTMLLKSEINYT